MVWAAGGESLVSPSAGGPAYSPHSVQLQNLKTVPFLSQLSYLENTLILKNKQINKKSPQCPGFHSLKVSLVFEGRVEVERERLRYSLFQWNLPHSPTALPPASVLHSWLLERGGNPPLIWDCLLKQTQRGGIVLWKLGLGHFTKCLQTFRRAEVPTVNAELLSLLGLLLPERGLGWGGR